MAFTQGTAIIGTMLARSAALAVCSVLWLACGEGAGGAPSAGEAASGVAGGGAGGATAAPEEQTPSADPGPSVPPGSPEAPGVLPLAGGGASAAEGGVGAADASAPGSGGASAEPSDPAPVPPGELSPLTIWIAGDSTVANGQTPCPRGWGGAFAPHFGDQVDVVNSAAGGRSVHTWLYQVQTVMGDDGECLLDRDPSGAPVLQPRWQAMLDGMQAGDYLFVQFGINDGDRTCDRHVGVPAFETALVMMANAALERGAHPILLTPVSMVACNGATARGSRGEFVPATLRAGEAAGVPVIDLHERSVALYQELGELASLGLALESHPGLRRNEGALRSPRG